MENEDTILSVIGQQNIESLLTPQEALKIKSKLWSLLERRTESYTMGGSSSVRVETAQELLKSAGFVLSHGFDSDGDSASTKALLLNGDFETLFRAGLANIGALVEEGKALLDRAKAAATAVENAAYRGTLNELGIFFKRYHYHHFAHEIPCMLDYPLAHPVDEALQGIDYINDYLRRLLIEDDFTGRFDPETVTRLLKSVSPDYKMDILNIYEAVAANALALTLIGGDIRALDVTGEDRQKLISLMAGSTDDVAQVKLRAVSSGLCYVLGLSGEEALSYMTMTAQDLFTRIKPVLLLSRLDHIFPSLYREMPEKSVIVRYVDGALMDDEKLRALIDTLTSCGRLSEKIALARRHICSLRDWAEVLGICFWGDELTAVFESFGKEELGLLLLYTREKQNKYPDWISETGWEAALRGFVGGE